MISKTARLSVGDNQYWICGNEFDVGDWSYTGFNGLVASLAAPGVLRDPGEFAVVMTGTETGDVRVTVEADPAEPGPPDLDAWDEIVEVSLLLGEEAGVGTDMDDESASLPPITAAGPGPYRVRVHARGRDAGQRALLVDGEAVEEHLIQIWSAPVAPTVAIKLTDAFGKTMRP